MPNYYYTYRAVIRRSGFSIGVEFQIAASDLMFFTTNYRLLRVPYIPTVDTDHFQSISQLTLTAIKPRPLTSNSRIHSSSVSVQFSFNVTHTAPLQLTASLLLDHIISDEEEEDDSQINGTLDYLENIGSEMMKEAERRRKIGLARKGKVPWNKGRNHTAETRALIVNRTRQALKDPKVRKRMFERQTHAYSTDTRAKMVMGQKRAWKRRYKMIEDRNKFYSSWGDCIAESAKKGLLDQQQLEWDSYEKMTSEIAFQQLHSAEEKENAMKMAKLTKMAKKERRAMQRKEKEEEVRSQREAKIKLRLEAKKAKEELQVSRKLKAKITKIRQRKPTKSDDRTASVATKHQPAIEKLDLEWIQREKSRRDLSLADQIEAAKQKRSVNGGHDTMTHQVDLDMAVKRLKPKSLLSFADEILAAKKKRAESAMKEALNGEDVATSRLQPSTEKPDFDLMRLKKVQSMSSFADQIQAAKQKQAGTKESVINGFQLHTKGEDLEDMRREKVQSMSSFADQIQAAKQKQATTKESVINKGEDLEGMRREKVGGMLSFADQIRAAKQKRAEEESAAKEAVAHHQPIS